MIDQVVGATTAIQLFQVFNNEGIKYCHWKSNKRLLAGLKGNTDLDVLVSRDDHRRVLKTLQSFDFQRFNPKTYLHYPAIEDYVGIDENSCAMLHLHLHWELQIGTKFIKGIHLPWEDFIFKKCKYFENTAVMVNEPEIELILLILRVSIKANFKKNFQNVPLSNSDNEEYIWLLERTQNEIIEKRITQLLGRDYVKLFKNFLKNEQGRELRKIRRKFKQEQLLNESKLVYHIKKCNAGINYCSHKFLNRPLPYRRTLSRGGCVITFLGIDGSGKSTLVKDTQRWLTTKLDTKIIYFGSGDGSVSLLRLPLKIVSNIRKKRRGNIVNLSEEENNISKSSFLYHILHTLWAISLAIEKKNKFKTMLKARNRSMIVICDRYPQTRFLGYNDGPLLGKWLKKKKGAKYKIALWEKSIYGLSDLYQPDISIKLCIDVNLAAIRKSDTPRYVLDKKAFAVSNLNIGRNIVEVDTSESVEHSMKSIKRYIWSHL